VNREDLAEDLESRNHEFQVEAEKKIDGITISYLYKLIPTAVGQRFFKIHLGVTLYQYSSLFFSVEDEKWKKAYKAVSDSAQALKNWKKLAKALDVAENEIEDLDQRTQLTMREKCWEVRDSGIIFICENVLFH